MTAVLQDLSVAREIGDLRGKHRRNSINLLDLLSRSLDVRAATDPRDNIHRYLSLVGLGRGVALIPNHKLKPVELYKNATLKVILHHGDLLPLVHAERPRRADLRLPSRVPDWVTSEEGNPVPYNWFLLQACACPCGLDIATMIDGHILKLGGKVIDRMSDCGKRMVQEQMDNSRLPRTWIVEAGIGASGSLLGKELPPPLLVFTHLVPLSPALDHATPP